MKSLIKQIPFHTGNSIPQIGFGTYELRGPSCQQSVSQAIQAGYRLIDTGTLYRNEQDLKTVLEGLYSSQKLTRSDMFLTSKIGPSEQGYENTLKTCEGILKKLGTNYLDLLIINWPGVHGTKPEDPMNAEVRLHTWRALERLKGDGKVRDIGVSNFLKRHLLDLFKNSTSKPVINQIEAHPLGYDEETIELCRKEKIVVEAYAPLARKNTLLFDNKEIKEIGEKYGRTIAQIVLRWGIQNGFVVIPKSKNETHIKENLEIFDFELSKEEMNYISGLKKGIHTCWNPDTIKF